MSLTGKQRHALMLIEASQFNGLSRELLIYAMVHPMTIASLLEAQLIEAREHKFAKPAGLAVLRYHATETGRAMVNGHGKT
jgi:hypothetical protein